MCGGGAEAAEVTEAAEAAVDVKYCGGCVTEGGRIDWLQCVAARTMQMRMHRSGRDNDGVLSILRHRGNIG